MLALPMSSWFSLEKLDVSDAETSYRQNVARPRPNWHREHAILLEKNQKQVPWYAVAFHWTWVVQAYPDETESRGRLNNALKHLSPAEVETLRRQAALK
jgi:hypothetical protein